MGFSKKTAKGRLDKYYFLAKDQGFRARSAFKLIQLNKKYNFLEKSRVLVDLCAAPGGWLQVAAKYMPVSQLVIGIDLAPIKPIPNVITMVNDITTEKCRSDLKRELKGWKADVFLNDGAPNVGSSWVHDAFTQAELVLAALKLATEFLTEGGTFVTKVFRSKDYNSLLWVFKQLFKTVEATKPASSRNVSAEIFVVCRGFLAPSHIDPKFLDPKHVFQEIGVTAGNKSQGLNILQPDKKQRHRDGYEDDQMILHKTVPVMDFIRAADPVAILSTANKLSFEGLSKEDLRTLDPSEDVLQYCEDLKVIGRKEFKTLLKWRSALREAHYKAQVEEDKAGGAEESGEGEESEADPLKELDDLAALAQKQAKREKRKELEKKAKQRLRLQLNMENAGDLADDMAEEGLFNIQELKKKAKAQAVLEQQDEPDVEEEEEEVFEEEDMSELESYHGSDEEEAARWDDEMEEEYRRFKQERLQKDALRFVKEQREAQEEADEDGVPAMEEASGVSDSDSASELDEEEEEDSGLTVNLQTDAEKEAQLNSRAALFYSNPIFDVLKKAPTKRPAKEDPEEHVNEDMADLPLTKKQKREAAKQRKDRGKKEDEEKPAGIVFVKADPQFAEEDFDEDTKEMMSSPHALNLATKLVADRRRRKQDLVDDSFNRYAFSDAKGLPSWFLEDENRHNKPQVPISKEAAALIKEKLRKLEAQPSKKVLEAKGRNKMRALKRLEALKKKASVIAESEDIGGRAKSEQIEKIMKSAKRSTKKEKKVVVARGKLKGVKGRPKGVKGHYKMVDARAKKDMRAQKKRKGTRR